MKKSDIKRVEKKYYAVSLPPGFDIDANESEDLIFDDFQKAKDLLKKYKESRLKICDDLQTALEYTRSGYEITINKEENTNVEANIDAEKKASLPPQKLAQFRKIIEAGDIDTVKSLIWSNPKYLISSVDTPVILTEGPRYNAVHVACIKNEANILRLVLETVTSRKFFDIMNLAGDEDSILERMSRFLDLYLNTPDKGASDTPLHFASKFGSFDCLKVLLSYKECDRNALNKFNQKAEQIICNRNPNPKIKEKIIKLFESRYVIIKRFEDQVLVEEPKITPNLSKEVTGIAGPMSPDLAKDFYVTLKSPARSQSPQDLKIRLTDASKGIERVARNKCQLNGLEWKEYWDFLDCYVNLASDEGLQKLENHLKNIYNLINSDNYSKMSDSWQENSTIGELCNEFTKLDITSSSNISVCENKSDSEEEEFFTPLSSPIFCKKFFIKGESFTQNDKNAAIALSNVHINMFSHPFVYDWLKRMSREPSIIETPNDTPYGKFDASLSPMFFDEDEPTTSTPRIRKSFNLDDLLKLRKFRIDSLCEEESSRELSNSKETSSEDSSSINNQSTRRYENVPKFQGQYLPLKPSLKDFLRKFLAKSNND